jgi:Asp-tRNA(Asn)/Glu-tRNA(Gln) amidotransferase A subunit family amidase
LSSSIDELEARFRSREPEILAFVPEEGRFARLRREAPQAGPLCGVFLGVKDVFHVDGFPTRAGSRLPPEELAPPETNEASCVTRLRQAGALIVGKTASTEFAYFAPGPTRNPVHPAFSPGGSSSGSAAAVAAGLCDLALGTQTIGSISRPAAYCGAVGAKPSYGRIPADGLIPLAPSLDHVGFFTRTVREAAAAAAVLCTDWQPAAATKPPVLGIPAGPLLERASAEGREHFAATCALLREAGFAFETVPAFADLAAIEERHRALVAGEAARVHARWYPRFQSLYRSKTAELIEYGQTLSEDFLATARAGREALRQELTELMDRRGIDLWLSPAAPGTAPKGLAWTGDPAMNLPWTHAGLPTLALPSGTFRGLPLGLQVAGRWQADEALLAWGEDLESALGRRERQEP